MPHAAPVRCAQTCRLQLLLLHLQSTLACSAVLMSPGFALAPDGGAVYVCGQCVCSTLDEGLQPGTDAVARLLAAKLRGALQVVAVPVTVPSDGLLVCGISENMCLMEIGRAHV